MDKNQVLRLLTSVAITLTLSACGATMKPDHPQVFDSFKERRPPKENVFVEKGALDELPEQRTSRFTPYAGPTYGGGNGQSEASPAAQVESVAKEPAQVGNTIPRVIEPDGTSPTVPSREQRTIWDRLKDRFSSLDTKLLRKEPTENHTMLASSKDAYLAQGSTDGYSYYEMADEIVQAAPVENIILAEVNTSAPLVDVPEPESYSDLKREGEKLDKQNLKDVPKATKKAKPTAAYTGDYTIQDKTAKIIHTNGQAVLTGSIGVIRGARTL